MDDIQDFIINYAKLMQRTLYGSFNMLIGTVWKRESKKLWI